MILTQGLNRQIRRMCSALGYKAQRLQRVRIMNIHLGTLSAGAVALSDRRRTRRAAAALRRP